MQKRIFIISIVSCVLIGFSIAVAAYTISGKNLFDEISRIGDGFVKEGTLSGIIEKYDSKLPASQVITKTYSHDSFGILGITSTGEILEGLSVARRSLYEVNDAFPVEYLHKVSNNLVYAVYKIENERKANYFMYLFFEKLDSGKGQAKTDTELWWLTGRVLFAAKPLEYKDFKSIKNGSTLSEVGEIDQMTFVYKPKEMKPYKAQRFDTETKKYVEYTETPKPVLSFKTYHYLIDGILCLEFSRKNADNEFVVSSVGFNEFFEIPSTNRSGSMPLIIEDKDFPKQ